MNKIELEEAIKFTVEQQIKEESLKKCIDFLKETDYITLSDYDKENESIKLKRIEARKFIRDNK